MFLHQKLVVGKHSSFAHIALRTPVFGVESLGRLCRFLYNLLPMQDEKTLLPPLPYGGTTMAAATDIMSRRTDRQTLKNTKPINTTPPLFGNCGGNSNDSRRPLPQIGVPLVHTYINAIALRAHHHDLLYIDSIRDYPSNSGPLPTRSFRPVYNVGQEQCHSMEDAIVGNRTSSNV